MKTLECASLDDWRKWLRAHHRSEKEIWLVFRKAGTSKPLFDYDAALDEALCWGWIDSLIKNIDAKTHARKFTPRNEVSKWSAINKKRVEKLIAADRMMETGLVVVRAAKANGCWDKSDRPPAISMNDMPEELTAALKQNARAAAFFHQLPPSQRKPFVLWIATAKKMETKLKRIREAIVLLEKGERLGLK
jgi:uncharacterized protein YdeI (YjbR/CyaY-like superfamily)